MTYLVAFALGALLSLIGFGPLGLLWFGLAYVAGLAIVELRSRRRPRRRLADERHTYSRLDLEDGLPRNTEEKE